MSQCSFEEPGSGNNCLLSSNPKAGQAKGQTGLCGRAWAQNLSFAVHDFGPQRDDRASADRWRGGGLSLAPGSSTKTEWDSCRQLEGSVTRAYSVLVGAVTERRLLAVAAQTAASGALADAPL